MSKTVVPAVSRFQVIDIVRALAVIGVVFNHTIDGLVGSGIVGDDSTLTQVNDALYIFRMPALAFVLGLFMAKAADRRGTRGYIREKVTFAVYIYLVWFVIQMLAEVATSSLKNSPRGWDSMLAVWSMPAHLWFMPFLAVAAVVVGLASPWRSPARTCIAVIALAVVTAFTWGWNPAIFGLRGLSLLLFTVIGAIVGAARLGTALTRYPVAWIFFGIASLSAFMILLDVGITPGTLHTPGSYGLDNSLLSALAAALGIIALLALAVVISYIPIVRSGLAAVGTKTLEIYLAHVVIVAGSRIGLDKLGVESEMVFLTVAMGLGLALPLTLSWLAPRLHMQWLFQTPGALGRWSRAANRHPRRRASATASA